MSRLKDKRIVITGSSRSLGREFALAVAREGASVVLNGTNEEALNSTLNEIQALGSPVCEKPQGPCASKNPGAISSKSLPHQAWWGTLVRQITRRQKPG